MINRDVMRELLNGLHIRDEAKHSRTLCGRPTGTVVGRFHGQSERMSTLLCGSCARVANTPRQRLLHGQEDRIIAMELDSTE
jgi:hypothetical protein